MKGLESALYLKCSLVGAAETRPSSCLSQVLSVSELRASDRLCHLPSHKTGGNRALRASTSASGIQDGDVSGKWISREEEWKVLAWVLWVASWTPRAGQHPWLTQAVCVELPSGP